MKTKAEVGEPAEEMPKDGPAHPELKTSALQNQRGQVSAVLRQFPVSGSLYGSPWTKAQKQQANSSDRAALATVCAGPALCPAGAASPGGDRLAWAPASGLGPAPQESHGQMGEPSQGTGEPKSRGTGGPLLRGTPPLGKPPT